VSVASLTKRNPDPLCGWFFTGTRPPPGSRQPTSRQRQPAKSSPHRSDHLTVPQTPPDERSTLLQPANSYNPHRRAQIPIGPWRPRASKLPRFRALALLGRLPPKRVDSFVIRPSEKPAQEQTFDSNQKAPFASKKGRRWPSQGQPR
jgi:hypothetical protein